MNRNFSLLFGGGLVLLGFFALTANLITSALGISVELWDAWRIWPMIIITFGLMFIAPPLLSWRNRGLGYLLVPGTPILTVGGMLMFGSLFDAWGLWASWWPLIVLSFGVGFFLASLFARNIYLLIPGLFFAMNGVALQFCTLTGLWAAWAVLWAVEPLSIGLGLLIIGLRNRSPLTLIFAFVLCSIAGLAFFGMSALFFSSTWLFRLGGPAALILFGLLVMLAGFGGKAGQGTVKRAEVLEEAML